MEFDHIGVATADLNKSIEIYGKLGFESTGIVFDKIQLVNICFMKKINHPDIELIEPVNKLSPVNNIIDKIGTTPYHICYKTKDLEEDLANLRLKKFMVVVKPVAAVAFNMKKVCFCFNRDFGLIELVEA